MKKMESRLEKSKKMEADTLNYLANKNDKKITLQEIEMNSSPEYFMCFLGCIKNFKKINRTYVREGGKLITIFSK
ncbi:hypothetical protein RW092_06705 [Paenibacillus sp. 3LSP]|uniref:hypothetical protein n=1 Tax=Bacilli TaxID=91061 RepID=UPI0028FD0E72|nr:MULTISPECIES: hypothetical protein [Bacilli]MDU0318974.1 hypothetical protein [Enterococcus sp. 2STP]MDU0329895.1 hypothetical protein [Paenibacillus sp. 3LSP]MDU0334514.1 hypothetical protein [Enterococcus sp. 2CBP]